MRVCVCVSVCVSVSVCVCVCARACDVTYLSDKPLFSDHEPTTAKIEGNFRMDFDVASKNPVLLVQCRGDGDPEPDVTWSREGGPLAPAIGQKSALMFIPPFNETEVGLYACNATNQRGSDVAYFACEYKNDFLVWWFP